MKKIKNVIKVGIFTLLIFIFSTVTVSADRVESESKDLTLDSMIITDSSKQELPDGADISKNELLNIKLAFSFNDFEIKKGKSYRFSITGGSNLGIVSTAGQLTDYATYQIDSFSNQLTITFTETVLSGNLELNINRLSFAKSGSYSRNQKIGFHLGVNKLEKSLFVYGDNLKKINLKKPTSLGDANRDVVEINGDGSLSETEKVTVAYDYSGTSGTVDINDISVRVGDVTIDGKVPNYGSVLPDSDYEAVLSANKLILTLPPLAKGMGYSIDSSVTKERMIGNTVENITFTCKVTLNVTASDQYTFSGDTTPVLTNFIEGKLKSNLCYETTHKIQLDNNPAGMGSFGYFQENYVFFVSNQLNFSYDDSEPNFGVDSEFWEVTKVTDSRLKFRAKKKLKIDSTNSSLIVKIKSQPLSINQTYLNWGISYNQSGGVIAIDSRIVTIKTTIIDRIRTNMLYSLYWSNEYLTFDIFPGIPLTNMIFTTTIPNYIDFKAVYTFSQNDRTFIKLIEGVDYMVTRSGTTLAIKLLKELDYENQFQLSIVGDTSAMGTAKMQKFVINSKVESGSTVLKTFFAPDAFSQPLDDGFYFAKRSAKPEIWLNTRMIPQDKLVYTLKKPIGYRVDISRLLFKAFDNINNSLPFVNNPDSNTTIKIEEGDSLYPEIQEEHDETRLIFRNVGANTAIKIENIIYQRTSWYSPGGTPSFEIDFSGESKGAGVFPDSVSSSYTDAIHKISTTLDYVKNKNTHDISFTTNQAATKTLINPKIELMYAGTAQPQLDKTSIKLQTKDGKLIPTSNYSLSFEDKKAVIQFKDYTLVDSESLTFETYNKNPVYNATVVTTAKLLSADNLESNLPESVTKTEGTVKILVDTGGTGVESQSDVTFKAIDKYTQLPLAGATIELLTEEGIETGVTAMSNEQGIAVFKELFVRRYLFKESVPPKYYGVSPDYKNGKAITLSENVANNSYTIEHVNERLVAHVQQVVLNPKEQLVIPAEGIIVACNKDKELDGTTSRSINGLIPSKNGNFTTYQELQLMLTDEVGFYEFIPQLPEYYKYSGYELTAGESLVSHSGGSAIKSGKIVVDGRKQKEVWLTVYISPTLSEKKDPKFYGWDYGK